MSNTIKADAPGVGDRVAYRASFLRSIGAYTGLLPFARGKVTGLVEGIPEIGEVAWDYAADELPSAVRLTSLCKLGPRGEIPDN